MLVERGSFGDPREELRRDRLSSSFRLLKFEVRGQENLDFLKDGGSAIIVFFPHTSHLDGPAIRRAFPPDLRNRLVFPAAADYWYRKGRSGWSSLFLQTLPLNRGDLNMEMMEGLQTIENCLRSGSLVVISPEGTRSSLPEEERKFHRGVSELILRIPDLPVIPVRLSGFREVLPKGASLPRLLDGCQRRTVSVSFGEPIPFSQEITTGKRRQQRILITAKIREALLAM